MSEHQIDHVALTIHIGEKVGPGHACTTRDFEIGKCHVGQSSTDDEDANEKELTGTCLVLSPYEAAQHLVEVLDNFLRKEFNIAAADVVERFVD